MVGYFEMLCHYGSRNKKLLKCLAEFGKGMLAIAKMNGCPKPFAAFF
jgi:hypothetical protein